MKIAVAGGHSGACRGAVGFIDEYIEDRKVAKALLDELKNRGHSVVDCSNEKTTQGSELAEECRLANNSGADLFVAIHFNATAGATGTEVWYHSSSSTGKKYASAVSPKLASALGLRNRGAKATTSLYVLKHTSMPAILVEVCFVDTQSDIDAYHKLGYQGVAAAIADGICGTNMGATSTTPAPSVPTQTSKPTTSNMSIRSVQAWVGTTQDGIYGSKTKAGIVKKLQHELNVQFGKGLAEDGIFGAKTKAACVNVKKGAQGNLTKTLQAALICHGYSTNGFDGIFGSGTYNAVVSYQKAHGLSADGIAGKATFASLLG